MRTYEINKNIATMHVAIGQCEQLIQRCIRENEVELMEQLTGESADICNELYAHKRHLEQELARVESIVSGAMRYITINLK